MAEVLERETVAEKEEEKNKEGNLLVTGGCGFIGTNFIRYLLENNFNGDLVNYDKLTYAGNPENLEDMEFFFKNYLFVQGDICDKRKVDYIIKKHGIRRIVNFAAESHVDRSIINATDFIKTNVNGARVLLDCAVENGIERFVQIGTDEVYGSLNEGQRSSVESDALKPSSPYSASKAAADLLALSYFKTHGLDVVVTRSSNNYGRYQFPEKLIPLFVTSLLDGKKVPLYGDGKNIRDWIHVEDNCRGIIKVLQQGMPGEVYNLGGGYELRNIDITRMIFREMKCGRDMIRFVEDRKGHDLRYSMNSEKANSELGWRPLVNFRDGLRDTIEWYEQNKKWWKKFRQKRE